MKTLESSFGDEALDSRGLGMYECKGSKFLSVLVPLAAFEPTLEALKSMHPKAVHFVYAFRAYREGQILERSSDDGEPKGSSGVPVLNVLRGAELVDCAVIVVRYFGGTLLGVGGLVRAYTRAAQLALESMQEHIVPFCLLESVQIMVGYAALRGVEYHAKRLGIEICAREFLAHGVQLTLRAQSAQLTELQGLL